MSGTSIKLRRFCAFVIGIVFFVSGAFKLMDPVGTSLIVSEYYAFFHFGFMKATSLYVGLALSLLETLSGVALMAGVFRKQAAVAVSVLLVLFTFIAVVLVIFNPSFDCGCFGEAVHLTHFQTLVKNIVLLALATAAFVPFRHFGTPKKSKYITSSLICAGVVGVTIYSLLFIPMIDFTPFKGASLLAAAVTEEGGGDDYVATFIYEKNGQEGAFTLDKLPDSTWTFVRTDVLKKTRASNESFPSLSFTDSAGEYRDDLAASGTVIVLSVYQPGKFTDAKWGRAYEFISAAAGNGYTPLLLVAGDMPEGIIPSSLETEYVFHADYRTLISLNRSNGGATYFNEGNLIEKWAWRSLPSEDELARLKRRDATETMMAASTKGRLVFQAFMLYSLILVLLF